MSTNNGETVAAGTPQTDGGESIPEWLRDQIPNAVAAFGQVGYAGYVRFDAHPLLDIAKHFKSGSCLDPSIATRYLNKCDNHTLITENREIILQAITSNDEASEHAKKLIKDSLRNVANGVLITAAISGGVQLLFTLYALWKLHKDIKNLERVAKENGTELNKIEAKLNGISSKLEEFAAIVQKMEKITTPNVELMRLNAIQKNKATEIENDLLDVEGRLEDLLDSYRDIRQELEKRRSSAVTAGVSGIVTGSSNIITTAILRSAGSPALLWTNVLIGGLHLISGGVAVGMSVKAKDKVKIIGERIDAVKEVKQKVGVYRRELDAHKQKIMDMILELSIHQ